MKLWTLNAAKPTMMHPNFLKWLWHVLQTCQTILHTLANWELIFRCFSSIQLRTIIGELFEAWVISFKLVSLSKNIRHHNIYSTNNVGRSTHIRLTQELHLIRMYVHCMRFRCIAWCTMMSSVITLIQNSQDDRTVAFCVTVAVQQWHLCEGDSQHLSWVK